MINATDSLTSNNLQTQNATTQKTTAAAATDATKDEDTKKVDRSEVLLSSRSKKVSALANEFFSGGGIASIDIEALKDRAFEYGLISESEYSRLKGNDPVSPLAEQERQEINLTASLAKQVNSFMDRIIEVNEKKPEADRQDISELTSKLENAANILSDVEKAMSVESFSDDIRNAITGLTELINADSFASLGIEDRVAITNAASALTIAEQLAPRKLTNEKLNQYVAISNR